MVRGRVRVRVRARFLTQLLSRTWNGSPRVTKQNGFPLGSGQFMMTL